MILNLIITGKIRSLEAIWFLGDEFALQLCEQHFKNKPVEGYGQGQQHFITNHFDTQMYFSSKFVSADQNLISRLRNMLVKAINEQILLPKYIVIIPDDDVIRYLHDQGITTIDKSMGRLINHLMSEHTKLIMSQKDTLPIKAKCDMYPQLIWIEAPLYSSFREDNLKDRVAFNECLQDISKFHVNTTVLGP